MQDWFREHQILKKVLVVQLPCHLEFLEVLILLKEEDLYMSKNSMVVICALFSASRVENILSLSPEGQINQCLWLHKTDQGE